MDSITFRNTSAVFPLLFSSFFSVLFELVCCSELYDSKFFSASSSPSSLKLVSADKFLFRRFGTTLLGVKGIGDVGFIGGGESRLIFRSRNRCM